MLPSVGMKLNLAGNQNKIPYSYFCMFLKMCAVRLGSCLFFPLSGIFLKKLKKKKRSLVAPSYDKVVGQKIQCYVLLCKSLFFLIWLDILDRCVFTYVA